MPFRTADIDGGETVETKNERLDTAVEPSGTAFMAERIAHFEAAGPLQAVDLWNQVARRFEELRPTEGSAE